MNRARLGIVVTHPIQYQVPLYRFLASESSIEPLVFFLSGHGLTESFDPGFGQAIKFDLPLIGDYEHKIVRNRSLMPSVGTPWGMVNPSLPAQIRKARLDAILVHGYSNISHWLAYAAAAVFRIPYMLRGESRPDEENKRTVKQMAKRAVLRPLVENAAACLVIGEENRAFYVSYGARERQLFFAPYSVDTDRFSAAGLIGRSRRSGMVSSLGLDPGIPLVLFAAKLQPWKRPIDVVMAIDKLDKPVNLVLIGDGPLRHEVERLKSRRPWMRTLGFVNQSDIAKWYGVADLFVLPSSREPWGLAVNEAMAAGAVPIVSDAVGCGPDLVANGVGWIYPAGDADSLARAIEEGCQPGVLAERRAKAKQRAAAYGIRATAKGIEMAVATVLNR